MTQGLGHKALGVVECQVLTELSDHAETVVLGTGAQVGQHALVTVGQATGDPRLWKLLFDQEAVEALEQIGLVSVVSASVLA